MMHVVLEHATNYGLGLGAFALLTWLIMFLAKRMIFVFDKFISNMDKFTSKVEEEHKQSQIQHQALMKEHAEMLRSLQSINMELVRK